MIPAFALLPEEFQSSVSADLRAQIHEGFAPKWAEIARRMHADRPAWGSSGEMACVQALARLCLETLRCAPALLAESFVGLDRVYADLLKSELATADIDRKLALRLLEKAFDLYFESTTHLRLAFEVEKPTAEAILAAISQVPATGNVNLTTSDILALRLQLDLLTALESRNLDAEEFAWWARRALASARQHAPSLALLSMEDNDGYDAPLPQLDLKAR